MRKLANISQFESLIMNTATGSYQVFNTREDYYLRNSPYIDLFDAAEREVAELREMADEGLISEEERYNRVIDTWAKCQEDVDKRMWKMYYDQKYQLWRHPDWDEVGPYSDTKIEEDEKTEEYINMLPGEERVAAALCFIDNKPDKMPRVRRHESFDEWYEKLHKNPVFLNHLVDIKVNEELSNIAAAGKYINLPDPHGTRAVRRMLWEEEKRNK